jgi:arginyl-tRNA synthetase
MSTVKEALQAVVDTYGAEVSVTVSRPEPEFGDYSSNVALQLAGKLGRPPRELAVEIAQQLEAGGQYEAVTVAGPGFINIRLQDEALWAVARTSAKRTRGSDTIVIETNNPNPFKAMHIGHALNAITADAIANLLDAGGAHVYRVSYHGDVGLHVGKSMYALLHYIEGDAGKLDQVPEQERNSFMSRMYAAGAKAYKEDEAAKQEITELAKQSFTREDPLYAAVYDTVFHWSFSEIDSVMNRLGNQPVERRFLESEADMRGVRIVRENVPAVFQESDGALIFAGSQYGSFDNAFVGSNGLGLYGARDIGLMELKNEQYHPSTSYIVTAEEQRDYFKGVIAAAGLVWPDRQGQTVNIPTGTLKLTTGKMSSRDGQVVEIAWLFDQIGAAIRERGGEPTEAVVAGALRYAFLKVKVGGDIIFDINEAVSIQGNSGPYLQYAHARACSILAKSGVTTEPGEASTDVGLDQAERLLLRKLSEYGEVSERSAAELLPHYICTYLYELSQEFNRFYEKSRVLGDQRERLRLSLVTLYRDTLAHGLGVLGIVAPDRL